MAQTEFEKADKARDAAEVALNQVNEKRYPKRARNRREALAAAELDRTTAYAKLESARQAAVAAQTAETRARYEPTDQELGPAAGSPEFNFGPSMRQSPPKDTRVSEEKARVQAQQMRSGANFTPQAGDIPEGQYVNLPPEQQLGYTPVGYVNNVGGRDGVTLQTDKTWYYRPISAEAPLPQEKTEEEIRAEGEAEAQAAAAAALAQARNELGQPEPKPEPEPASAPAPLPNSLAEAEAEAQARAAQARAVAAANSERGELPSEDETEEAAAQAALLNSATGLDLGEGRAAATPLSPSATLEESAKVIEAAKKQLQESAARQAAVKAQLEALSAQRKAQAELDALQPKGGKRRRRKHKTPRRPKKRQGRRARKSTFRRHRKH
jgi:hypothetical protein